MRGVSGAGAGGIVAVAGFAVRTNGRMWITRAGLLAGTGILLLGPVLSLSSGRGWTLDPDLGFFGFLVAAVFGFRSGLEEQRETGLALFLRYNLVPPVAHAAGLVVGLVVTWLLLCAWAFVLALAADGDPGVAAWHTAAWGLRALVLLGTLPLVESVSTLRTPFILPVILYFGLLVALSIAVGEETARTWFAPVERGDLGSLAGVARHAAISITVTTSLFLALAAYGARRGRRAIFRP